MNGRLVTNTGPLIALAVTDQLHLLPELFDEVLVPGAVDEEPTQDPNGSDRT